MSSNVISVSGRATVRQRSSSRATPANGFRTRIFKGQPPYGRNGAAPAGGAEDRRTIGTRRVARTGGNPMAKYLVHGSYSATGISGVLQEGGSGRVKAIEALAASVGGHVDSFYFAFG